MYFELCFSPLNSGIWFPSRSYPKKKMANKYSAPTEKLKLEKLHRKPNCKFILNLNLMLMAIFNMFIP